MKQTEIKRKWLAKDLPDLSKLKKEEQERYEGLARIEIAFASEAEAKKYVPETWFGREITNTPLWRDALLLNLTDEKFKELLNKEG